VPKIDKIKEQIGWLKVVFAIFMAIEISLIAWLANNYDNENISASKVYLNVLSIFIVSVVVILINKTAFKKIDELGEL